MVISVNSVRFLHIFVKGTKSDKLGFPLYYKINLITDKTLLKYKNKYPIDSKKLYYLNKI